MEKVTTNGKGINNGGDDDEDNIMYLYIHLFMRKVTTNGKGIYDHMEVQSTSDNV